ncbi:MULTISPECIES: hypothetical protein [unclassified Pseudovibrio]|uniref:hypothetical protein n=1 Tax=unclassified Pseudovibrio TaxID=2627060 RepID=UPI0007B17C21|nr:MULTISPECIES: hypothetical protein [unclassified Pseudovibrio]KZL16572.1 hypothetical protein PsAD37_04185 [Pseudovibrio sp. Ad37]KZL21091.1 hypothetical protein PsWM33_04288 [Pseudovibrio sp. WM33]
MKKCWLYGLSDADADADADAEVVVLSAGICFSGVGIDVGRWGISLLLSLAPGCFLGLSWCEVFCGLALPFGLLILHSNASLRI